MVPIAIVISSSLSSLSLTSLSLQDEIKQAGRVFFVLFLVCTLMVIVGVVLEEIEWRVGESYVDAETGIFSPARRRTSAKLGLWLLVIGIAGEGVFEIARSWTDGLLQNVSNTLLLNAEAQTGNAAKSATTAHNEADAATREADLFKQDIISAKTQAADAESHLADALQRAANAERELAELKAKSAPRRLTPAQEVSIASQLSIPSQPVDLLWYAGSSEGEQYGTDIFNAINNMAHWDVNPTRYTAGQSCLPPCPEAPITDLVIFTMPTDRSEQAGKELYKAFRNAHVPVELAPISVWWISYTKMSFKRDSLAREDARLVVVVGNHP